MKHIYLFVFCLISAKVSAQVSDIVSLGQGYANQAWYSLQNGLINEAPKAEWDLAFSSSTFSSSIHVNSANGTRLWTYPNGDISNWNDTWDISGVDGWTEMFNSATTWEMGAFDINVDGSNQLDFGWGTYNFVTHVVTGDSLFVLQLSNGEYKKLKINELSAAGVYSFTYADINGANETNVAINKTNFSGKNFGYYSIVNGQELDREPDSSEWDLLFTQYTDFIPTPYLVAGVLHNEGITVAQVDGVNSDIYEDYQSHNFNEDINELGYDWKTFGGMGFNIAENRVYFIQSGSNVWKLVFTGFGGSSNGNYEFTKELLGSVNIADEATENDYFISLFPNPSDGRNVNLLVGTQGTQKSSQLLIHDSFGKLVHQNNLTLNNGINTFAITSPMLAPGVYTVSILFEDGNVGTTKMIVQ
jgi:hypothetical protein